MWKTIVKNESLVALYEVFNYFAVLKLDIFEVCFKHKIQLVFKLQLQKTENISTLLSQVNILWENCNWENLRQFINTKCRENWYQLNNKVLVDEKNVIKFIISNKV